LSRKLKPQPKLSVAKRQPSRWQHERNLTLIIWIVIPLTIALALGLVGYWGYDTYVAAWTQPVVKIGNETIGNATAGNVTKGNVTVLNMRYYVKMLRYYSLAQQGNISSASYPYQVLQQIEGNVLVRQAAPGLGIRVTPDEVTQKITDTMISLAGGGGNTTGNTTGNVTGDIAQPQTELGKIYQQWLNYIRLSDNEYRQVVEAMLLAQKLSDQITQSVPTEAKQVHLYAIQVSTEGNATEVEQLLQNGGNFTAIAAEFSTDETSKQYGGDLGWLPQGILLPELDKVAFSLPAGNISQPIQTSNAYYVIKVAAIEDRPIDEQYRQILASNAFTNWFNEQRDATEIREYLDQTKITWALNHVT
jgi:parvulin-like peptidyl-prolyl isomerase